MPDTTPPSAQATDGSVSCVTSVFCMAVGMGSAEQWNGSTWAQVSVPALPNNTTQSPTVGVSCVSAVFCVEVGSIDLGESASLYPLVEQWNGASWSIVVDSTSAPTVQGALYSVSCMNTDFCMATGGFTASFQPIVDQWNGATWTPTILPMPSGAANTQLSGVSCTSPAFCMAVGFQISSTVDGLAEAWNGSSWSETATPPGDGNVDLTAVSCVGGSFCSAVGVDQTPNPSVPLSEAWNGSTWTEALPPPPPPTGQSSLQSVSCFSATSCTAVGSVEAHPMGPRSPWATPGTVNRGPPSPTCRVPRAPINDDLPKSTA